MRKINQDPDPVQTYLTHAFHIADIDKHEESVEIIQRIKGYRSVEFLDKFRKLILDTTRTWTEKADYVFPTFDPRITEAEHLAQFMYMWKTVMEVTKINEPWPPDEK